jgi:hypothetical protein
MIAACPDHVGDGGRYSENRANFIPARRTTAG